VLGPDRVPVNKKHFYGEGRVIRLGKRRRYDDDFGVSESPGGGKTSQGRSTLWNPTVKGVATNN